MNLFNITWSKKTLILLPLNAFLLFDFIQLNMMGSVGTFAIETMHILPSQLGLISSLFFYVNLILLLPAGKFLDKYPPKWCMAISLMVAIIGITIFALSPNIYTMYIWRAFSGVAGAFSYLSCVKVLSSQFPRKYLGLLLGLTGIVIMSAGIIAQYPLIWLLNFVGLNTTMLIDAAFGIVVIVMILVIFEKNSIKQHNIFIIPKKTNIYLNPNNWLVAIFACLTNFPLFVLGALWGNLYLQNEYHVSIEMAATITSLIFFGNMLGAPTLGFISDRLANRTILMTVSSSIMLLSITAIVTLPASVSLITLSILFLFLGVSTGAQTLAYASIVDINKSENIANATSLLSLLSVGGGAVTLPLFGFISNLNSANNYQHGMYIILFSSLLAFLASILFAIRFGYVKSRLLLSPLDH